jgi:hypothetical protein
LLLIEKNFSFYIRRINMGFNEKGVAGIFDSEARKLFLTTVSKN